MPIEPSLLSSLTWFAHIARHRSFTRAADGQIIYQFTVDDPTRYKQPWKGEMPLNVSHEPLYEYACHEGNYSMFNMMSGARQYEREGRKNGSRKAIFAGVAEAKE